MAKAPPAAAVHTPRPSSLPRSSSSAYRTPIGSSSSKPPLPRGDFSSATTTNKGVAKHLAYDDDDDLAFPDAPAPEALDADLAPLLYLPDPADSSSSTTVVSAAPEDSSDSALTEVAAPVEEEKPLPEQVTLALAELHADLGLSPRSRRLITALVEAAAAEVCATATAARLRRAAFWTKVRVGVLAATVAAVAAIDVALAIALLSSSRGHDELPPT